MNQPAEKTARRHLNIVDVILLIVLILSIVGIGFRVYLGQHPRVSGEMKDYEVYIKISDVYFTIPSYLTEGSTVYLENGETLGTLLNNNEAEKNLALFALAAEKVISDGNGGYVTVQYPDQSRVDATGAILAKGIMNADGLFVLNGSQTLTPGQTLRVHTENTDFTVSIQTIETHNSGTEK